MKLVDLEATFRKRSLEHCLAGPSPTCSTVHAEPRDHEVWLPSSFEEADGVEFLCPKCFAANGGAVGTHGVVCWRPRVPADVSPKPGRWKFQGTGLHDLTLVAGSSSVLLTGGCGAHFYVRNGSIEMCP